MKRWAAILAGVSVSLGLGACGITAGPVETHQGPAANRTRNDDSELKLRRPDAVASSTDLVRSYLLAAADKQSSVLETVRSFMTDKTWKPNNLKPDGPHEVNVYRTRDIVAEGTVGLTTPVRVTVQQVGVLREGRIEPVYKPEAPMHFEVQDSNGYMLSKAPAELMISDEALDKVFERRELFYWDNAGRRMVPDVRYVPKYLSDPEKAKLLVGWLMQPDSESSWLREAVKPVLQQPLNYADPVLRSDGTLEIDLQGLPAVTELAKLRRQLEKSLLFNNQVLKVQLKIQGQQDNTPAAVYEEDSLQVWHYAVAQEKVVRLATSGPRRDLPLPDAVNNQVEWAAFSRGETAVALKRHDGFFIGISRDPKPVRVGSGPVQSAQWLFGDSKGAAVLVDNKLYHVPTAGESGEIAVRVPGKITSFSVVPDGRMALTIAGKLYVAALFREGDVVKLTTPVEVPTAMSEVRNVAISKRSELIIAGANGDLMVVSIMMDGSQQSGPLGGKTYNVGQQISRLTCDYRLGTVFYDYLGGAWQPTLSGTVALEPKDIARQGSTPSASATPGNPPKITSVSIEE